MTKILLVGGGSGGHITPTLAVAESLKTRDPKVELLYVGSTRPQDAEIVGKAGISFRAISAGKLRRYFDVANLVDAGRVLQGFFQSLSILRSFRPDVIFTRGGYVIAPVVWAAKLYRIPLVLHESDSVMSLANRLAYFSAIKVATAFPVDVYPQNLRGKMVYTGLPMGRMILGKSSVKMSDRSQVVIIGGSQGAMAINHLIWDILPEILAKYDLVHQVGEAGLIEAEEIRHSLPSDLSKSYRPVGFDPNLRSYIQAADAVVARAGSTLHELAAWGVPVITVPLPGSASDHQAVNAKWFASQNAVVVLEQAALTGQILFAEIDKLISDKFYRDGLVQNISKLGGVHKLAADKVADMILEEARAANN